MLYRKMYCSGGGESIPDIYQHGAGERNTAGTAGLGHAVETCISARICGNDEEEYYIIKKNRISDTSIRDNCLSDMQVLD